MKKQLILGLAGVLLLLIVVFLSGVFTKDADEFRVVASTVPATPIDILVAPVGNTVDVEIGVVDTLDEPDDTPWTLCGTIAGTSLNSFENNGFSYDVLGSLDPIEQDVMIRQDIADESVFFPQGGATESVHTFRCVAGGTNDMHLYFMTSRSVRDCRPESLRHMQEDPLTEKKIVSLGEVRCIDPTAPPETAGLEHSEGTPVEEVGGFEYIGGQTIEIGTDGQFIDHGYLDRENQPD